MIKKLAKHGDDWAIVMDQPVLDLLGIGPETPLEISSVGNSLLIKPAKAVARSERFQAAVEEINRKYGHALKRLAD